VTLILTHIRNPAWVLQVTDRLVSKSVGSKAAPYDPESNKNLVFLTNYAVVSIGYTGLSYLEGIPSDEWIAEALWGEKLIRGPTGGPAMSRFAGRQLPTLGPALKVLADKLTNVAVSTPAMSRYPVFLAVTGWMAYAHKEPRPFFCTVGPRASTTPAAYAVQWVAPRHFGRRHFVSACPNGYVSLAERKELLNKLGTAEGPKSAEELLIQTLRIVAERSPETVGADCISISLSPPHLRQVIVEYLPGVVRVAVLRSGKGDAQLPVSYTPWILSPLGIHAPTIMGPAAGTHLVIGEWTIQFRGPSLPEGSSDSGIDYFAQSQKRKPPPR
jgi:hypothetical protein